jgi:transposase-like protein
VGKRVQYSPETRALTLAVLDRNRGNFYRTAKETGISHDTLRRWVREGKRSGETSPDKDDGAQKPLSERLEALVSQMVAVMPEKVEEANLQEIARTLTIVLDAMNKVQSETEESSHAREKLAEILERYAHVGSASGTDQATDGEGSG